jgi:hypothetical protein
VTRATVVRAQVDLHRVIATPRAVSARASPWSARIQGTSRASTRYGFEAEGADLSVMDRQGDRMPF